MEYTYEDGYSTILKDHEGKDVLIHTWLARTYTSENFHKVRIDKAYEYAKKVQGIVQGPKMGPFVLNCYKQLLVFIKT